MNYACCIETTRRNEVKSNSPLNGIDFLEVSDNGIDEQKTLYLHFLNDLKLKTSEIDTTSGRLSALNIQILGGERIRNIRVESVIKETASSFPMTPPDEIEKVLVIHVSKEGDFSTYTLRLVQGSGANPDQVPDGFDPIFSEVDFSFKVNCPSEFDCKPVHKCPPKLVTPPEINYLAKDYASFRQLMLDRMALLMPDWRERNPADLGIVLVELLAYVGDYLSYQQDAIATEAYLTTARKRISVRRHARLVDYYMHDGCNARTWLQIWVGTGVNGIVLPKKDSVGNITRILTKTVSLPTLIAPTDLPLFKEVITEGVRFFELMDDVKLYTEHNEMHFYLWFNQNCCLPKGATKATLDGHFPNLEKGNILILAEVLGAETGQPEDADPTRRHAVRITKVEPNAKDILTGSLITEIEWDNVDALPFPLCISKQNRTNISVVWGNIVLADHGRTIESPPAPPSVPAAELVYANNASVDRDFCEQPVTENVPARYRPKLLQAPVTQTEPYNKEAKDKDKPAAERIKQSLRAVVPFIELKGKDKTGDESPWYPKRDLLDSRAMDKEFVAEIESDGTCYLRFGDGKQGERPEDGTQFTATYRIGNGKSGNVGADTLVHLITAKTVSDLLGDKVRVWNPLPAQGGLEAETMEEVRQFAPEAFRTQERAVTSADYAFFAQKSLPDVQRAATTFRWTGSWKTVFLTVDRLNGAEVTADFETKLRDELERYRMAGFDLEVDAPVFVSLDIALNICVNPRFFDTDVKQALLEIFSNRLLSDGRMGFFHPDNFTFGQPVYLSQVYAAAQSTEGVDSVAITKFCKQGDTDDKALKNGQFLLGRREIARCDNDRNFPERGVFNVFMKGGRR